MTTIHMNVNNDINNMNTQNEFSAEQLRSMDTAKSAAVAVVAEEDKAPPAPPPPSSAGKGTNSTPTIVGPPVKTAYEQLQEKLSVIVKECVSYTPGKSKTWAAPGFIQMGDASTVSTEVAAILSFRLGPSYDTAWATYRTKDNKHGSCVLTKTVVEGVDCGLVNETDVWMVCLDHRA